MDVTAARSPEDPVFSQTAPNAEENGPPIMKEASRSPRIERYGDNKEDGERIFDRRDGRHGGYDGDGKRGFEERGRHSYHRDENVYTRRDRDRFGGERRGPFGRDDDYGRGRYDDRWRKDNERTPWRERGRDYDEPDRRRAYDDGDRWGGGGAYEDGPRWDSREDSRDREWNSRLRDPSYPPDRKDSGRGIDTFTLLVRNVDRRTRPGTVWKAFERYGRIKDVYMPRDYYTRKPKGFAFVQFLDTICAKEALRYMDGERLDGRVVSICYAQHMRKTPEEMRRLRRHRDDGIGRDNWRERRPSRGSFRGRRRSVSPARDYRGNRHENPDYHRPTDRSPWQEGSEARDKMESEMRDNPSREDKGQQPYHEDAVFQTKATEEQEAAMDEGKDHAQPGEPGHTDTAHGETETEGL